MKILTSKFRDDRDAAAILFLTLVVSCHTISWVGGDIRNHPEAIAGDWTDSAKATPADTSVWRLGPTGQDESFHLVRDNVGAQFRTTRVRSYGYWYVRGALSDTVTRAFCFTNRPGRSPATCIAFQLDSAMSGASVRRRLVLLGYAGQQHTTNRVLIARAP